MKKQKQQKKWPESVSEEDPFETVEFSIDVDLSLPSSVLWPKSSKRERGRIRSHTVTSPTESTGSRRSLRRGRSENEKRPNSTFYVPPATTDVTTPFTHPIMDIEELRVSGRSQAELLHLMKVVGHRYNIL